MDVLKMVQKSETVRQNKQDTRKNTPLVWQKRTQRRTFAHQA